MHDTLFAGRVPGAAVANIDPAILDEIDAVDWSASSVGPVSDWQPAFRETARMMLASLQPMVMLMGADGSSSSVSAG